MGTEAQTEEMATGGPVIGRYVGFELTRRQKWGSSFLLPSSPVFLVRARAVHSMGLHVSFGPGAYHWCKLHDDQRDPASGFPKNICPVCKNGELGVWSSLIQALNLN